MANTNVRSTYIQQIAEDTDKLAATFADVAKDSLSTLLDENIKKNLRQIISEGDSYTEDVTDDPTEKNPGQESDGEGEGDVTSPADGGEADKTEPTEVETNTETEITTVDSDASGESEGWDGYEHLKGDDGKYDLTGMEPENLVKVFRELGADDGITVVKNPNGTVELNDQETDRTYLLAINDGTGEGEGLGESKDVIDNYQKNSAMTVDSNKEVANPSTTYSMDGGVPQGTDKPFPGKGDNAPFDSQVKESEDFNIDLADNSGKVDEGGHTVAQHSAQTGSTTVSELPDTSANSQGRNSRVNAEVKHTTSENPYSSVQESKIREALEKANKIALENKQLRQALSKSVARLQEAIILNKNMGNIVKLMIENTTSSKEKNEIALRFGSAKTIEESNRLYEAISGELKARSLPQVEPKVSITESVNNGIKPTQPMYQSNEMTEFMKRMDAVYTRKR